MSPPATPSAETPRYSLRKRLVAAFGVLLVLFLGLAGFVLDRAFKESVAAAVQERLQLQIYALLGVAEPDGGGFFLPDLGEARFSQIDSGLYGFILDQAGGELWRSPSALNIDLAQDAFDSVSRRDIEPGQMVFGEVLTPRQGRMSYARYGTFWANRYEEYSFIVMESVAPTAAEIREFQSSLWFWLGGLALLLSVIQFLLLHWGLSPLQRLAADVSRIEAGESDQLEGEYPKELQAVSQNLNLLIRSERERQSRYSTTLGDLAHSLKTPLAVIGGLVQQSAGDQREKEALREIAEQAERMNQIVSYQLKRAVNTERPRILARAVEVKPVLQKVLSALQKVYRDKEVRLEASLQEDARFLGEQSDLMEVAGNLLDNAFKYCGGRVEVSAAQQDRRLVLRVDDDGAGIPADQRQWVLERGARADTLRSGQGIGLTVARDIIASYGGGIAIDASPLGGARIEVIFDR